MQAVSCTNSEVDLSLKSADQQMLYLLIIWNMELSYCWVFLFSRENELFTEQIFYI